jgi:hypothetical protein
VASTAAHAKLESTPHRCATERGAPFSWAWKEAQLETAIRDGAIPKSRAVTWLFVTADRAADQRNVASTRSTIKPD